VSVWVGSGYGAGNADLARRVNDGDLSLFGAGNDYVSRRDGPPLLEAFRRLFPRPLTPSPSVHVTTCATTEADFLDALYLFARRDVTPFSVYLSDSEHSAFFRHLGEQAEVAAVA